MLEVGRLRDPAMRRHWESTEAAVFVTQVRNRELLSFVEVGTRDALEVAA